MSPSFTCNHFTKRESEYDLRDQNVVHYLILRPLHTEGNLLDTVEHISGIVYPHI